MSEESRARLASLQAELAAALVGEAPAPAGFDDGRVAATAELLARKRRRLVVRAWPGLAAALGEEFDRTFSVYAAATPLPPGGSPLEDGRGFARDLDRRGLLPDAGRMEAMAVDLRTRRRALPSGRGPVMRVAWLRQEHRLVAALLLPWGRVRWFSLGLRAGKR